MSLFLLSARLGCKRMLRRRGTWLMLLLLPLFCVSLCTFWALEQPMIRVKVGVAYDHADEFHAALFETLSAKDIPVEFRAYRLEEQDEVERLVQTGQLECAYLLHEGLRAESVAEGDREVVTLLKSPQSVLDIYFSEVLFSALYAQSARAMDLGLLADQLGMDGEVAEALLDERVAHYEGDKERFLQPVFELQTPGGAALGEASVRAGGTRILHGVAAVFLLVMTVYALPALIDEKQRFLGRLDAPGARRYLLGTGAGLFALGFVLGTGTLLLSGLIYPPVLVSWPLELAALGLYQLALSALGMLAVLVLRRSDAVYGAAVFLVLLTMVLGGVLLDIDELSRGLGALSRIFPSSYYLDALHGSGSALGVLTAIWVVASGVVAVLVRREAKKEREVRETDP